MSGLAELFRNGGAVMFLVLLFGGAGIVVAGVQLLLRGVNLTAIIAGCAALTLFAGTAGSVVDWIRAFSAIAAADPSMKATLAILGFGEGLAPIMLASAFLVIHGYLGGVALTLRANLRAS